MNVIIKGKSIDVTQALRFAIEERMERLQKYFHKDLEVQVTLEVAKLAHRMESSILVDGKILRAEDSTTDMYRTLDLVVDKLERQAKRLKGYRDKGKNHSSIRYGNGFSDYEEDFSRGKVVKVKRHLFKPMSQQEAMLQIELLEHGFYVYENDSTGEVNVIYKRKDGDYGLIVPEY